MKRYDKTKQNGRHYTPPALARFLASRAARRLSSGKSLRILDPACGDGELLVAAYSVLSAQGWNVAELVGCDVDEQAVDQARERLADLAAKTSLHAGDFLEAANDPEKHAGFDLIITNPPYVRTQVLGAQLSGLLSARFGLTGRVDLTHPFVALSKQLLSKGGVLALLCSNRFLSTKSGINVRKVLSEDFNLHEIFDLGDTKLFRAAVLPAVVIASREERDPNARHARFVRVYEAPTAGSEKSSSALLDEVASAEVSSVVSVDGKLFSIEAGNLAMGSGQEPWTLESAESRSWVKSISQGTWKTFGELAKTRVGIKTTADAVFIRDDWAALPDEELPEPELLLPLITHENVEAWHISENIRTRVLYPYDLTSHKRRLLDMSSFPRAMRYFNSHRDRLAGRKYVIEGGRQWYEIWVPQRPGLWRSPKIVFPDISEEARFAIDRSGAVVNGDCYWICVDDLPSEDIAYLMIAVANSRLGLKFYDTVCGNKLYAGRRRWITQYVERLPLPHPETTGAVQAISLARKLCEGMNERQVVDQLRSEIDKALNEAFAQSASACGAEGAYRIFDGKTQDHGDPVSHQTAPF